MLITYILSSQLEYDDQANTKALQKLMLTTIVMFQSAK